MASKDSEQSSVSLQEELALIKQKIEELEISRSSAIEMESNILPSSKVDSTSESRKLKQSEVSLKEREEQKDNTESTVMHSEASVTTDVSIQEQLKFLKQKIAKIERSRFLPTKIEPRAFPPSEIEDRTTESLKLMQSEVSQKKTKKKNNISVSVSESSALNLVMNQLREMERKLSEMQSKKSSKVTVSTQEQIECLKKKFEELERSGFTSTSKKIKLKVEEQENPKNVASDDERNELRELKKKLAEMRCKAPPKTGITTREKLKKVKIEIAELEGSMSKIRSKDALSGLETKLKAEKKRKAEINRVFELMTAAQAVDLCFLVDCTGSMASYIKEVKDKIQMIVDKSKKAFPDLNLTVAFVGYRDHCDGPERTVVLNFTASVPTFQNFVGDVVAKGGGDTPEDVFGGLEEVISLTWSKPTRILFHVADAPCHGSRFHVGPLDDGHPDGDPRGLTIEYLLPKIQQLKIIYWFAKLSDITDKMIQEFEGLMYGPTKINQIDLSSVNDLVGAVAGSISASININEGTVLAKECEEVVRERAKGRLKSYKLDPRQPDWEYVDAETGSILRNKFPSDPRRLRKPLEVCRAECSIKIAPNPFAEGGLRIAYYGIDCGTTSTIVLKQFKYIGEDYFDRYLEQMEIQSVAVALAKKFNSVKPRGVRDILFVEVSIVTSIKEGKEVHLSQERHIKGKYVKFNNNSGFVSETAYTATLNAFSHWTYQVTGKYLMVVDLQGVKEETSDGTKYILTDPAIHCGEYCRFGNTNLGRKGMHKFFQTHYCNSICNAMSLEIHRLQPGEGYKYFAGATVIG